MEFSTLVFSARPQGLKLHDRGLKVKAIAQRVGVSQSSVYSWTKALREQEKQERDAEIARLRDEGKTQQEIADELEIGRSTVAEIVGDSKTGISDGEPESVSEPQIEPLKAKTEKSFEATESETPETDEAPADEKPDSSELDFEPEMDDISAAEEEPVSPDPESEPAPPEEIPDGILSTARAVMGAFTETRPDDYVARLVASGSEQMTITDDSLSNELERDLLTSAAAMCLWQEWMIWYQGERANAFTDAFGKIGPVFVRGRSGQWRIVSRLRSILKRLWA